MRRGSVDLSLDLPPGESALIAGPPLTGKYRLLLEVLAASADAAVVVSTNTPAGRVLEDYRVVAGDVPEARIGVVDCISNDERTRTVPESDRISYVNSPRNLTRIGVAFTETLGALEDLEGTVGVGLHNVSALLVYADIETVFKFVQVFTGQAGSRGATCVAVLDTDGDGEHRDLIAQHFDGVIETRENDAGEHELRVRGFDAPPEWRRF